MIQKLVLGHLWLSILTLPTKHQCPVVEEAFGFGLFFFMMRLNFIFELQHEKTNIVFLTNPAVQPQKTARGLKFWIWKVKELYYTLAKTKALINFVVTAKLICVFVSAYSNLFSHDEAQLYIYCCLYIKIL